MNFGSFNRQHSFAILHMTPLQWHQRILHATFSWNEHILQGADAQPGTYQKPQGFSVMVKLVGQTVKNRSRSLKPRAGEENAETAAASPS